MKFELIESYTDEYSISLMCRTLEVSLGGDGVFYSRLKVELMQKTIKLSKKLEWESSNTSGDFTIAEEDTERWSTSAQLDLIDIPIYTLENWEGHTMDRLFR